MATKFKLRQDTKIQLIAEERIYLTADRSKAVKEGDEKAAFLLAGVGQSIPIKEAERLGLVDSPKGTTPEMRSTRPEKPEHTR